MRHKSVSKKLAQLLDRGKKKTKRKRRRRKKKQESKTKVKVKMIEKLYA